MRIAVTSAGPGLEDRVDPRFGRCAFFVIVQGETMEFEAVENPNVSVGGGAGIASAQLVAEREADVVLTGNCGPNAFRTLEAAGVQVVVGVGGTVREAVEAFQSGGFSTTAQPNVADHFGIGGAAGGPSGAVPQAAGSSGGARGMGAGGGRGMGRGMGGGRGMGRGMRGGRGMGRGMGAGMVAGGATPGISAVPTPQQPGYPQTPQDALAALKSQAEALSGQLEAVQARIEQIERGEGGARLVAGVDAGACTGCGICVEVCPTGAMTLEEVARVDAAACNGCARCVVECPEGAISLGKL